MTTEAVPPGYEMPQEAPYLEPEMGTQQPYPYQNAEFLQWLLNFKKEVTVPLRYLWRGYEQDENGFWRKRDDNLRVMNEKGIMWAISYIESFINPVYLVSNYQQEEINWTMRMVGQIIYNNMACRYKDFEMNKLDIQRVASEILTKIHAILLGSKNNGFRLFLSSTHQTTEVKSTQEEAQKKGIFPKLADILPMNRH